MGPTFSEPQKRFRLFLFLLVLLLCVGLVIVCFPLSEPSPAS